MPRPTVAEAQGREAIFHDPMPTDPVMPAPSVTVPPMLPVPTSGAFGGPFEGINEVGIGQGRSPPIPKGCRKAGDGVDVQSPHQRVCAWHPSPASLSAPLAKGWSRPRQLNSLAGSCVLEPIEMFRQPRYGRLLCIWRHAMYEGSRRPE